ncbi:hypothetical protein DIPPA_04112 [Diplonema papillatum]|nr:hypothetical protein DIPPA_04112 [Diplonema papillatum]
MAQAARLAGKVGGRRAALEPAKFLSEGLARERDVAASRGDYPRAAAALAREVRAGLADGAEPAGPAARRLGSLAGILRNSAGWPDDKAIFFAFWSLGARAPRTLYEQSLENIRKRSEETGHLQCEWPAAEALVTLYQQGDRHEALPWQSWLVVLRVSASVGCVETYQRVLTAAVRDALPNIVNLRHILPSLRLLLSHFPRAVADAAVRSQVLAAVKLLDALCFATDETWKRQLHRSLHPARALLKVNGRSTPAGVSAAKELAAALVAILKRCPCEESVALARKLQKHAVRLGSSR